MVESNPTGYCRVTGGNRGIFAKASPGNHNPRRKEKKERMREIIKLIIIYLVGFTSLRSSTLGVARRWSFIKLSPMMNDRCTRPGRPGDGVKRSKSNARNTARFSARRGHGGIDRRFAKRALFTAFKMKPCSPNAHLGQRSAVFAETPAASVLNDSREFRMV